MWHRQLWLIDHGAALIFHHHWGDPAEQAGKPFTMIKDHVLLPWATAIAQADEAMAEKLTPEVMATILAAIPDEWLAGDATFTTPATQRAAYQTYFTARLAARQNFVQEAQRAAGQHL